MKKIITVSSVVLVHAVGFLLIAGCNSESGFEDNKNADSGIYSGRPVNHTSSSESIEVALPPSPSTPPPVVIHNPPPPPSQPPPPPPPPVPTTRTYIVKQGDSLWIIAKREGVSVSALAAANGFSLSPSPKLKLRQKIKIPAKGVRVVAGGSGSGTLPPPPITPITPVAPVTAPATGDGFVVHTVERGQVLGAIALKYKVSVAQIMDANGITDAKKVRAGRKLRIPAKTAGAGAGAGGPVGPTPPTPPVTPPPEGAGAGAGTGPGIESVFGGASATATPGDSVTPPPDTTSGSVLVPE
ncbi:MAG: LysM peptidoglycan-binding domain-containing protein [Puniceicoccales bacterium]|jgi:LysM repeat protein|nr:LysM peptidoglycan-binding domain-containing protein [Puniceicoccales bacterium]